MSGRVHDVERDFEAWAVVAARLRQRSTQEKRAILDAEGIAEATWSRINEAWAKVLNDDIAASRMDRPYRYAELCKAELARRNSTPPAPPPSTPPPATTPSTPPPPGRAPRPDFRDSVTPPAKPPAPRSRQMKTAPGISREELGGANQPPTERFDPNAGPAPDDFRRELVPVEKPLAPPMPYQIDTVEGGEGAADLVEAASQAKAAALWPLAKWAELCSRLEAAPEDAERIWREVGVTNPRARPHIRDHWKKRLAQNPAERDQYKTLVSEK